MGVEFFKTSIPKSGRTDDIRVQTVTEGDIIIPDSKPDIAEALITDAYAVIRDEKVSDGRVSYGGDIKVNMLYRAKNGENPVYSVRATIPFMDFVNSETIKKGEKPNLRLKLTDTRTEVVNDRKVNIRAMGEARITGNMPENREIITGAEKDGSIQVLEEDISYFMPISAVREEFTIEDKFNIPSNMPAVSEILRTTAVITDSDFKPGEDKITARGAVLISALYTGEEGAFSEKAEFKMPFGGTMSVPGVTGESIIWGDVYVKDFDVKCAEDDNGNNRVIEAEAEIAADIWAGENRKTALVKDIYSLNGEMNVKKEAAKYPERGIFTTASEPIRETVTIDEAYPDILQIKDVTAEAEVEDVHIDGDVLTADGVLNVSIFYVTRDDGGPVKTVRASIPFEHEIEVRGLYSDAEIDINANVSDINYSLISDREAEIRAVIDYSVFSLMNNEGEFIDEAVIDEEKEIRRLPGITIYTIRKGDTLWNIAKAFNTTLDEILSVNIIEDPDLIYPGQRILILKRR